MSGKGPVLVVALIMSLLSCPALALETPVDSALVPWDTPWVYQRGAPGGAGSGSIQTETGYGSRESRNFTQAGFEQGLRVRFNPLADLALEAFGGLVFGRSDGRLMGQAASIEALTRLLDQRNRGVDLDLGVGYIYDYQGDHIPRVRVTLSRSFDRFLLSLSGLAELPVGDQGRDEVDIMTSAAVFYRLQDRTSLGLEVAGEDLEGFFEEEEAEGGAKLLFGPTLNLAMPGELFLKLNTAAVYAHLANQDFQPDSQQPDQWGFMGRLVLGWSWR